MRFPEGPDWAYYGTGLSEWSLPSGVTFAGNPAAVALGDDRLSVGGRTTDDAAHMALWDFGGNAWVTMGGALYGSTGNVSLCSQ
jgi:hypothetical protein